MTGTESLRALASIDGILALPIIYAMTFEMRL